MLQSKERGLGFVCRVHNFPYRLTLEVMTDNGWQEDTVAFAETPTAAEAMAAGLAGRFPESVIRVWEMRRAEELLLRDFNAGR